MQEVLFQRRLVRINVCRVMLSRDLNDLRQCTLYVQLKVVLICSLSYFGHALDIFEPFHRGRVGETDLHIMLADVFELGNMINLDQPSFADDRHTVAGMLYLGEDMRGEEDGASLGAYLGHHFVEFLLVEWVETGT